MSPGWKCRDDDVAVDVRCQPKSGPSPERTRRTSVKGYKLSIEDTRRLEHVLKMDEGYVGKKSDANGCSREEETWSQNEEVKRICGRLLEAERPDDCECCPR